MPLPPMPLEFIDAVIEDALSRIPEPCLKALYRSGCLVWGEGSGEYQGDNLLAFFLPKTRDAALLSEAHKRTRCFNMVTNSLLIYTDMRRYGFASSDGFIADGMYIATPDVAAQLRQNYLALFGLPGTHEPGASGSPAELMVHKFFHRLFNPREAKKAIQLLSVMAECKVSQQPIVERMTELGINLRPFDAKFVNAPAKA